MFSGVQCKEMTSHEGSGGAGVEWYPVNKVIKFKKKLSSDCF